MNSSRCHGLGICLLASAFAAGSVRAQHVWWEAEGPERTNFPSQTWMSAKGLGGHSNSLSAGEWLSAAGPRGDAALFASYRVVVATAGEYTLWARKFWRHGPFRWRFDAAAPRECGRECALADNVALVATVCANWVELGSVDLAAGEHRFEIELLAAKGEDATAAFDCFLLMRGPFIPDGKRRPGEKDARVSQGAFAFPIVPDEFSPEALLDLRSWNEARAGQHGPIRAQGSRLVRGDGETIRWFGVNAGPGVWRQSQGAVRYLVRKLAKLGVNLVRLHGALGSDADPVHVDPGRLDAVFFFVAACRDAGIYTTLSTYFPLWFRIDKSWGIDAYEGREPKHPFALIYFDARLQAIQRAWLASALGTVNPYTGLTLAKEPALAAVELVNEDSFFFWTFGPDLVPPDAWRALEGQFHAWLDQKRAPRGSLLPAWNMTREGMQRAGPEQRRRVREQVRFLAETQRGYYARTIDYLKRDLGYGGLAVASNWHVSDPGQLDAVERWTYEPADIVDAHGYFGGRHEGPRASYAVGAGDSFSDLAFVDAPERLPLQIVQTLGKPQIVSEIGWPAPNRKRVDGALVAAAYAAANGLDGLVWFAVESPWLLDPGMTKFGLGTPDQAFTYPVAALLFRRGDLKEAEPVRRAALPDDLLFALTGSSGGSAQLDPLRAQDGPARQGLEPRVFLCGPVVRSFEPGSRSSAVDLTGLMDTRKRLTRHAAGEVVLDEARRLLTIDGQRCQAASGYLGKAGRIELRQLAIECRNEYAAVAAISLDGEALSRSKRILLQAATPTLPFGFAEAGGKITAIGSTPAQVQLVAASVTLRLEGPPIQRVLALDCNGQARPDRIQVTGSPPKITLAPDTLWHIVIR